MVLIHLRKEQRCIIKTGHWTSEWVVHCIYVCIFLYTGHSKYCSFRPGNANTCTMVHRTPPNKNTNVFQLKETFQCKMESNCMYSVLYESHSRIVNLLLLHWEVRHLFLYLWAVCTSFTQVKTTRIQWTKKSSRKTFLEAWHHSFLRAFLRHVHAASSHFMNETQRDWRLGGAGFQRARAKGSVTWVSRAGARNRG